MLRSGSVALRAAAVALAGLAVPAWAADDPPLVRQPLVPQQQLSAFSYSSMLICSRINPPEAAQPSCYGFKSAPSVGDIMAVYPRIALRERLSGLVSLDCTVASGGRLGNCTVKEETPRGVGFGRAAQSLASKFEITRPSTQGIGLPTLAPEGMQVSIPVQFNSPTQPPRSTPEAAPRGLDPV